QAALSQAYRARVSAATAALHGHDVVDAARELDEAPKPLRAWEWWHLHSRLDESSAVCRPPAGSSLGLIDSPEGLRLGSITSTDLRLTDEDGRECLALPLRLFRGIVSFGPKRGGLWVVDVDEHQTLRLLDEAGKVRLSADGR